MVFVPLVAHADVVPTEEWVCRGAGKGDKCDLYESGPSGTCRDSTCSRNDYSHRSDSGTPSSVQYGCLKCLDDNGAVPTGVTSDDNSGGCSVVPGTSTFDELWALVANAASFGTALLSRQLFGVP